MTSGINFKILILSSRTTSESEGGFARSCYFTHRGKNCYKVTKMLTLDPVANIVTAFFFFF